jgi:phage shock protein C
MTEIKARFERLDQRLRNIEECVTDREFELRRELKKLET